MTGAVHLNFINIFAAWYDKPKFAVILTFSITKNYESRRSYFSGF